MNKELKPPNKLRGKSERKTVQRTTLTNQCRDMTEDKILARKLQIIPVLSACRSIQPSSCTHQSFSTVKKFHSSFSREKPQELFHCKRIKYRSILGLICYRGTS